MNSISTSNNIDKAFLPKAAMIAIQKKRFIAALYSNYGNVSKALLESGLSRKTAYAHFSSDEEFADAWRVHR